MREDEVVDPEGVQNVSSYTDCEEQSHEGETTENTKDVENPIVSITDDCMVNPVVQDAGALPVPEENHLVVDQDLDLVLADSKSMIQFVRGCVSPNFKDQTRGESMVVGKKRGSDVVSVLTVEPTTTSAATRIASQYCHESELPIIEAQLVPRRRRIPLYLAVFCVATVIVGITALILSLVLIKQPDCTEVPAPPVTFDLSSARYLKLQSQLFLLDSPTDSFVATEEMDPRFRALHWLANEDPLMLSVTEENIEALRQRYTMVLLYFSTSGWSCWANKRMWLSAQSECRWDLLICQDSKSVSRISLRSNGLYGTLPNELGELTAVTEADFAYNALTGTVPGELGRWTDSTSLSFELGALEKLQFLSFTKNKISGTLPSELGQLSSLEELYLSNNLFAGTVPVEVLTLPKLERLFLHDNQFTGELGEIVCDGQHFRSDTQFVDVGADCIEKRDLSCPCCSFCCNSTVCCSSEIGGPPACHVRTLDKQLFV